MFDEMLMAAHNVISLADARAHRRAHAAQPLRARICCHCGATLGEGENEEECSGASVSADRPVVRRRAE
jgi:hypothetical protein